VWECDNTILQKVLSSSPTKRKTLVFQKTRKSLLLFGAGIF